MPVGLDRAFPLGSTRRSVGSLSQPNTQTVRKHLTRPVVASEVVRVGGWDSS